MLHRRRKAHPGDQELQHLQHGSPHAVGERSEAEEAVGVVGGLNKDPGMAWVGAICAFGVDCAEEGAHSAIMRLFKPIGGPKAPSRPSKTVPNLWRSQATLSS